MGEWVGNKRLKEDNAWCIHRDTNDKLDILVQHAELNLNFVTRPVQEPQYHPVDIEKKKTYPEDHVAAVRGDVGATHSASVIGRQGCRLLPWHLNDDDRHVFGNTLIDVGNFHLTYENS